MTNTQLTHTHPGPIVRIAPNHISIADPDALNIIYGHGNGALKSKFYDAFVSIQRGVFNTRDRTEHARKRKLVSHIFSQKSVVEFEPHIRHHIKSFINHWDSLYERALKGESGNEGEGWHGADGRLWLDCLPCKSVQNPLMVLPYHHLRCSRDPRFQGQIISHSILSATWPLVPPLA